MWSAKAGALLSAALLAAAGSLARAADLSSIVAVPQRGQSADRARRDRYECHNWAIEQTGVVPAPTPDQDSLTAERRAERVARVLAGAGIGATVGSIVAGAHHPHDAAEGALAGGVLGAIVGAATGHSNESPPEDEAFDAYYRALSACLGGRGYDVLIAESP
jgi:Glycine zipper